MSDPFIAEVKLFAGNFAPRGYAFCNGQLLPVSQNTALFSLVGTTYGGDGRTNFGIPDMEGRAPMHPGRGPGLSERRLGQEVGSTQETLTEAQTPQHKHGLKASSIAASNSDPAGNTLSTSEGGKRFTAATSLQTMATDSIAATGGGAPHNNMQPYLGLNFVIALVGLYPST